jgi:hypothetical protein
MIRSSHLEEHILRLLCYCYDPQVLLFLQHLSLLLLLLLQKHGAAGADISTPAASTTLANIKIAYGAALGRELLDFEASHQSVVTCQHSDALKILYSKLCSKSVLFCKCKLW